MINNLVIIQELEEAVKQLDHNKVTWTDKHLIVDLQDKAQLFLESVTRFEGDEKKEALSAAQEFIAEIKPVVLKLNNQEIGA